MSREHRMTSLMAAAETKSIHKSAFMGDIPFDVMSSKKW
jgi:hypothetical protein